MTRVAVATALAALVLLLLENALLNLAVPRLLAEHPERLTIDYTAAWTLIPGRVHVTGLRIHSQNQVDEWLISADSASGVIDVSDLFSRHFHASSVQAHGAHLRYLSHPMQGPVAPRPMPAVPWLLTFDGLEARTDEIWIGDYRLTGDAQVSATLSLAGPHLDLDSTVSIGQMRADIGDMPVAQAISGEVSMLVDTLDLRSPSPDKLRALSGNAEVRAEVQDLRFLDFYLEAIPWLSLEGAGEVRADFGLDLGQFRPGSTLAVDFPSLLVRFMGNEVTGAGKVRALVGTDPEGAPQSLIAVDFDDFAITSDGIEGALAYGTGFHLQAQSPDVLLDQPFTSLTVTVDLPASRIPDVTLYNAFLPQGIGLSLRQGTGTIRGNMVASSATDHAEGDLYLEGDEVMVQFDALTITGDLALHARLAGAQLGKGLYDLSGSTFGLHQVGIVDRKNPDKADGERRWRASIVVPSGTVQVGAPIYLDARVKMTCTDSVPFVTLFADRKSLPGWVQGLLSVEEVSGEARLQFGPKTLQVGPCDIRAGSYRIGLRLLRDGRKSHGQLLAHAGPLSLGIALHPGGHEFKLFRAKQWFEGNESR